MNDYNSSSLCSSSITSSHESDGGITLDESLQQKIPEYFVSRSCGRRCCFI